MQSVCKVPERLAVGGRADIGGQHSRERYYTEGMKSDVIDENCPTLSLSLSLSVWIVEFQIVLLVLKF